jgi:carboxyl-terminal processing protease
MYVPSKNDSPQDFVRLLAPSRSYGEKDLDAHLVSTYAKDTDKPAYDLPFIVERKAPAPGEQPATAPPDDEDDPDADEIVEDFEIRFAKDLVSSVRASSRPKLVAAAQRLVARVRADEAKKLQAELAKIGIDWSSPTAADTGAANLEVALTTSPAGNLKAGDVVDVTATVKNTGAAAAYHVLSRIQGDDPVFEDTELPVGKIGPGETKTFTAKVQVPKDALDRVDRLGLEVKEARNAPVRVVPTQLRIEAAPRPVFAYSYQLIDEGNGDGLVQRGERYRLVVQVKNTGAGATSDATVLLRNATGDGVVLDKSRFELKDTPLSPGQVKELEFPLKTDATLKGDEMIVELMAYDAALDVQTSQKLRFKVSPSVAGVAAKGDVTVRAPSVIRAGASDDSSTIGRAPKGATYAVLGTFGPYTKVKIASRVGFLPSTSLGRGGSAATSTFTPDWNSTPPIIDLHLKGLETSAETYRLAGTVKDEEHVEDVYIFVSNQGAKIDSRKVFYRSNRGGKNGKLLDFTTDLPLWPGSNMITVVARANSEVKSVKTMYVYRDGARTAQAP